MASRNFALNETPHEATVGSVKLLFLPEVDGPTFAEAYDKLRAVQLKVKNSEGMGKALAAKGAKKSDGEGVSKELLVELSESMHEFIGRFLYDDPSRTAFDTLRLPDRVLAQMLEWVAELYGSGSGNDDATGQSSD